MSDPTYQLPQAIKRAAKHGQLVVFLGAGASMLCGSPDWKGFASQVVAALEDGKHLNFLEAEQLKGIGDPRRTLSIAMALAREKEMQIDFEKILHPQSKAIGIELYKLLADLRPVFVTTNYDKWLDADVPDSPVDTEAPDDSIPAKRPDKRTSYYLPEHLTTDLFVERGAVIHLHGSYADAKSMVVSLKDYITHYADDRVRNFLKEMFRSHTVLFVGYGLAELEVLDHIIRSNEKITSPGKSKPSHFLLYGHRSSEVTQTAFLSRFFEEQCGVQLIPYCIDKNGYAELVEVFKAWGPELDVRDPTLLDLHAHLDAYIKDEYISTQRESAIRMVQQHPELTAYFLNSIKHPIWFSDVDKAGFFDSKFNPPVTLAEEQGRTLYQAEGWPALRFLESISSDVIGDDARRIVEIIREITKDAEEKGIDNFRTWWSLSTIFSQLPLDAIDVSDIALARTWLKTNFDARLVGADLGSKLLPRLLDSELQVDWGKALELVDILFTLKPKEASQ